MRKKVMACLALIGVSCLFMGCMMVRAKQCQDVMSRSGDIDLCSEHDDISTLTVPGLARQFHDLRDGRERIRFVVELIDRGIIAEDRSINDLRGIFGDRCWDRGVSSSGEGKISIYLADTPKKSGSDGMAAAMPIGWGMMAYYAENDKITAYYLTNLWKVPGMSKRWKENETEIGK